MPSLAVGLADTIGLAHLLLTWHYIRLLMRECLPSSASFDPNRAGPGGRYRLAAACSGGRALISKQSCVRIDHAELPVAQGERLHIATHGCDFLNCVSLSLGAATTHHHAVGREVCLKGLGVFVFPRFPQFRFIC